jgi:hypothetical protein
VPVLWREDSEDGNPWGVSFKRMLDMSNDCGLFHDRQQLESDGWRLQGNTFCRGDERMLPLYEAKMVHHYDHRFGDYADKPVDSENTALPDVPAARRQDPSYAPLPRYWVAEDQVEKRLEGTAKRPAWPHGWLLGWRDICRSTDMRTVIASVIPRVAVNDKFLLMLPGRGPVASLAACLQSMAFDYVSRQKVGGTSLKYFTMKQLPVLPPETYDQPCPLDETQTLESWIRERVLELTYTSHELAPFARSLGDTGAPFIWNDE